MDKPNDQVIFQSESASDRFEGSAGKGNKESKESDSNRRQNLS